jgi:hypothetical protein
MKIELSEGGYEKIDAQIQAIEELAFDGVLSRREEAPKRCQQIIQETRKIRQILREVLLLAANATCGKGSAA